MTPDPKQLLAGFATDSLVEGERQELLRAALDDQALFDALVEAEGVRELLQDPAARQELLAVVEQQTPLERLRAWFERPATLIDLGAVSALVLAALAGYALLTPLVPSGRPTSAARPLGVALSPRHVAALLQLPAREAVPAGLEIVQRPDAVFAPGEPVHLRLSLRAPARVALLHVPPGGLAKQAWPALGQAPGLVPSPASGGPAIVAVELDAPLAPGAARLRLVVAPADLDLGALEPSALPGVAGQLTLVDLGYKVVTRP